MYIQFCINCFSSHDFRISNHYFEHFDTKTARPKYVIVCTDNRFCEFAIDIFDIWLSINKSEVDVNSSAFADRSVYVLNLTN